MEELRHNVGNSLELVGNLLFWASSQLNGMVATPVHLPVRQLVNEILALHIPGDTISIRARQVGAFIEICIVDTGIGIKEEMLNKIRRKESVTTYGPAKEKGTGLGMLLCQDFTEENKGRF